MEKLKGDALKAAACRQISFSAEKREMMHHFCEELALPVEIEEQAVLIYKTFLRRTLDITISPKPAIGASIYIAALLRGEHRKQVECMAVFHISEITLRNWWHFVADVVGVEEGNVRVNVKKKRKMK